MESSNNEDDITCSICMNYIHYEVDMCGGLVRKDGMPLSEADFGLQLS